MLSYSLNNKSHKVNFQQDVIKGRTPDSFLYLRENVNNSGPSFFDSVTNLSNHQIALQVIKQFKKDFSSYSFSDDQNKNVIRNIYKKTNYIAELYSAIGYLGLKKEMPKL